MSKRKFWPLDFDLEGEIYENPAWDLPGLSPRARSRRTHAAASDRNAVSGSKPHARESRMRVENTL